MSITTAPLRPQRQPIVRRVVAFWRRRDFSEQVGLGALAAIVLGAVGALVWYVAAPIDNSGVVTATNLWADNITNVKVTHTAITIDTNLYPDADGQDVAMGICTEAASWASTHGGQDVEVNGQADYRLARTGSDKVGDFAPCVRT
jgi:hypothetical protein